MAAGAVALLKNLAPAGLWDDYPRYTYNASAVSNSTEIDFFAPESLPGAVALYSPPPLSSPVQLGLATGLLLALVIHARRDLTKERQWLEAVAARSAAALWCLLMAAAALPAAGVLLALCSAYRALVAAALSCALGDDFAGLLEGGDAVWAVENDAALAVINVLALVQVEDDACDAARLLSQLRLLLQRKVEAAELPEKLLLLRRHSPLGYFYWQRRPRPLQAAAVIREHVRSLDELDDSPGCLSERPQWLLWSGLKKRLSELANSGLPQQHAAGWELLVAGAPLAPEVDRHDLLTAMEEGFPEWCGGGAGSGVPRLFPVLFRIHHSVGDGVALLGLLMDTLAGKQTATSSNSPAAGCRLSTVGQRLSAVGRASPIISKVPTLRAMPATTTPGGHSPAVVLCTETEHGPKSSSSKSDNEVARWLHNGRNSFGGVAPKWAPPRPATPASRRGESPAPSSRPTTPFQCFIDSSGSVSFNNQRPAPVNSRKPIRVGSSQNGALSPLSRPGSPISRPGSPVPPYISTSPVSATPRKRVLNGQTPLRPYSPNGIRLHCYNGADTFVTFPDDACAGSSNLGERSSTTIYYYNPADGGTLTSKKPPQPEQQRGTPENSNSRASTPESVDSAMLLKQNAAKPRPMTRSVSFDLADNSKGARKLDSDDSSKRGIDINNGEPAKEKSCEELTIPDVKIEEIPEENLEIKQGEADPDIPEDWLKREQDWEGVQAESDGSVETSGCESSEAENEVTLDVPFCKETNHFNTAAQGTTESRHEWLLSAISRRYAAALRLSRALCALVFAPAALLHQGLLHEGASRDGPLHAHQLSGRKAVSWLSEPQLLEAVRGVRRRCGEARFSDVLLAALAGALERHLGERAPRAATVVLPARLQPPAEERHLDNRFSVALLSLPVAAQPCSPARRLAEVARLTAMLRQAPDYQVNYWMMRVVAAALPSAGLRAVLRSARSSVVLSNMRGPDRPVSLAGHRVRDLVFWVPNRGANGLGVSVLSYAGSLQLGLLMDQSLASSPDDDSRLLAAIATELHRLEAATAL